MPVAAARRQSRSDKKSIQTIPRPTLDRQRNYSVTEAALTMGVAAVTIWRAIYSGHLRHYRVGRRVLVSGEQLVAWRDAGGKTGHGASAEAA
jgi:excisionase family DNA binding protein